MSQQIFDQHATDWWDPQGPMKVLHHINPCRLQFVEKHLVLQDQNVLELGCGGGILSESLASKGAHVTAVDLESNLIDIAKQRMQQGVYSIDYRQSDAFDFLKHEKKQYAAIILFEILEHIASPEPLIRVAVERLKPGGKLFISTLNRSLAAQCIAIYLAEDLFKAIPKGTHDPKLFIKPSEIIRWAQPCELIDLCGLVYEPTKESAKLIQTTGVNYILCMQKA